jgi:hypothetical protein
MWNPFGRKRKSHNMQQTSPFPLSLSEVYTALEPYMNAEKAMDFFFEFYIMDVIGVLPPETVDALDEFVRENAEAFETGDWRSEVIVGFELSDTIDVAILDRWLQNGDPARNEVDAYYPLRFATDFSAEYFSYDGDIDEWSDESLAAAKARIAAHKDPPKDRGPFT